MEGEKTVLVVEDTSSIRDCLCYALQAAGFDVHGCNDGPAAVYAAVEKKFQVIIIDYHLPNMNGADVTWYLRFRFPSSFIIGVSSDNKKAVFLDAGADVFLQKPYRSADIINLINERNPLRPEIVSERQR